MRPALSNPEPGSNPYSVESMNSGSGAEALNTFVSSPTGLASARPPHSSCQHGLPHPPVPIISESCILLTMIDFSSSSNSSVSRTCATLVAESIAPDPAVHNIACPKSKPFSNMDCKRNDNYNENNNTCLYYLYPAPTLCQTWHLSSLI